MARFKAEKSTSTHLSTHERCPLQAPGQGEQDSPHNEVSPGRLLPPSAPHPEQAGGLSVAGHGRVARADQGRQTAEVTATENMDGEPPSQVFAMTTGPVPFHFNELPHSAITVNKQGWFWSPQCAATVDTRATSHCQGHHWACLHWLVM